MLTKQQTAAYCEIGASSFNTICHSQAIALSADCLSGGQPRATVCRRGAAWIESIVRIKNEAITLPTNHGAANREIGLTSSCVSPASEVV
ncbi:MAG: hypothetical protein ACLPSW_03145 [Roseiarcus sp.]